MDILKARICATRDTTANWNQKINFIPLKGEVIVYTDAGQTDDGSGNTINVPGIKVGDGTSYLIDMPFVGADIRNSILQELRSHENDWNLHVSNADREFWNNKLNYTTNGETLILNRN